MGFQPTRRSFFLGQALSQADRDHYLVAISRALVEAEEIDNWLKAHPEAKLKVPETTPPSPLVMSPYFVKWVNFLPIRTDMIAMKERLSNPDPSTWSSITPEEHTTFGWVSVVDQIFSAFKADPKNLTVGRWVNGQRLPDEPEAAGQPVAPVEEPVTLPIVGDLPPRIAGIPTKTVLIGGGAVVGLAILLSVLR